MGIPVTFSVTLMRELRNSRERESRERQTDEMDRRVADDIIAQTNRTNEVAQNTLTSCPRME